MKNCVYTTLTILKFITSAKEVMMTCIFQFVCKIFDKIMNIFLSKLQKMSTMAQVTDDVILVVIIIIVLIQEILRIYCHYLDIGGV